MAQKATINNRMRIYHRYLGFFLAGIMAIYAVSGIVLIFRTTDFLKQEKVMQKTLAPKLSATDLGKAIKIRDVQVVKEDEQVITFKQGSYNKITGEANYTITALPPALEKLTELHKASTKQPLFYLNVFFGLSLLFFVVSSFFMFMPGTTILKKGLYFTAAGILLTLVMLFW